MNKFEPGEGGFWTLAIDDSPTKRFGACVEAANVHHNPTPGPGDGEWLYGHNWVCLAMVLSHPMFGVIALPLLSRLYVRKVDIDALAARYDWEFRTKHQLALDLCRKVIWTLRALGSKAGFVVVFDGAYAGIDGTDCAADGTPSCPTDYGPERGGPPGSGGSCGEDWQCAGTYKCHDPAGTMIRYTCVASVFRSWRRLVTKHRIRDSFR